MAQHRTSILLVEDDLSLRDSLCDFLRENGFETLAAGTLREAWTILHGRKPGVCLLDMNLPDGSGRDLLRQAAGQGLALRVIVMTAFDLPRVRPADSAGMVVGWLTKPVNPADLLRLVQEAIRMGRAGGKQVSSGSVSR